LGILVSKFAIKVNYTRKIYHFFVFLLPFGLKKFLPYNDEFVFTIIAILVSLSSLVIYVPFIKNRIGIVGLMYKSFDRPEDRPNTLKWLFLQYLMTYIIALPFYYYFKKINHPDFIFIPIFINAFGDGLAEPIGVRFGKHKYLVNALFSEKKYERSLEGSLCVFMTSVVVILNFKNQFSLLQFALLLILIPIVATLAEAKSPHTIDSPFIFFSCCFTIMLMYSCF
jgi:phytol kinase